VPEIRGALSFAPVSGGLFLTGFFAVSAAPPFGLFISELLIVMGAFQQGFYTAAVVLLASTAIAFIGLLQTVSGAVTGPAPQTDPVHRDRFLLVLPPVLLLLVPLALGLFIPDSLACLMRDAAAMLEVAP
jgi:hydrogenase-4 component F